MTGAARIILTGLGPKVAGLRWESDRTLRIGRIAAAEVMLRDHTVDRLHAEVKRTGDKWLIRDLAENELFPTLVNGAALLGSQRELRDRDVIQIGKLLFKVTLTTAAVAEASASGDSSRLEPVHDLDGLGGPSHSNHPSGLLAARRLIAKTNESSAAGECLRTSCAELQIQAVTHQSWDEALANVANDRSLLPNQAMLTLLRANHHLSNLSDLQQLLQSILADAVKSFDAQGGAILLFHPTAETLEPTVVLAPRLPTPRKGYSKTLSERCFRRGESLLCCDVSADQSLAQVSSVKHGAMASVLCALLRTPRRKLGVLHLDRGPFQEPFTESELYLADAVAASVAIGIECAQVVAQQREQFIDTVASLARAVEMRDQYTGDHTRRVTDYALLLADELQVPPAARYQLQIGTPLHDIGKIGIDDAILRKPGKLTPSEFDIMKSHTVKGAAIVANINGLQSIVPIVRHHHEKWDGTGYPDRLGRDQIALTARIVAVADAFDAMTSHRPYRPAMPPQLAFLEIVSKAGTHFDPLCVQALLRVRSKVETLLQQSS